ncbi:alginate export family protein [Haloferula chungangensis]|uniref:Alginate export family protein n=1 Tax=Haloferula chungangensis TaxID=1048331 RepID=A0ABW2L5C2_9BACT
MKYHILPLAFATIITSQAGTPAAEPAAPAPAPEPWIKPILDIRARFEYGDVADPLLDSATAFTTRERVGLVTKDWHGFSALVEGEFTQAIDDNYNSSSSPTTSPNNPFDTQINDPETNELNQLYLQYKGFDTQFRGGRQRIILDNAAFVGNVGWRQNEQTYDGISISNTSIEDLTIFYSYINRANRIFGSDATGALRSFAGNVNLFNVNYRGFGDVSLTAYAYLMDFDETAANAGYISNNTYGGIATTPLGPVTLYGEFAFQTDTDSSPAFKPDLAGYTHLKVSTKQWNTDFNLGWEYLDADFVTPLATVHAFNGFADTLTGARLGLVRNPGISDLYISHTTPIFWGMKFSQFIHLFGDNNSDFDYGWEYDAVLAKKFNENFLAIAKFSYFDSDGAPGAPGAVNPAPFDTTRFSIELNYTF